MLRRPEDDPCVQGLIALAAELGVWLLIGSALVGARTAAPPTARCWSIPRRQVTATYDKIHMFDVDLPTGERVREFEAYTPGTQAVVAPTPFGAGSA